MGGEEQYMAWLGRGERLAVSVPAFGLDRPLSVQVLRTGQAPGPHITFLHGFPTSSWDFAQVIEQLQDSYRVLAFDFLGFGNSDKPADADYSIHAQADLVEHLWAREHIEETVIVAHDYGASVALELLARRDGSKRGLCGVTFLNGGLYPELHRPLFIQKLLALPVLGSVVTRLVNEKTFSQNMARILSPEHQPTRSEMHALWTSVQLRHGHRIYHKLVHYMADRRTHAERWLRALEQGSIPKQFLWGMRDPISGAHVAARLKERLRPLRLVEMHDVGHYPQLEAPERVVQCLRDWS